MKEQGLQPVDNPSALFLAERPVDVPGSVVVASIEGTRPILVELQALVSPTALGTPRRTTLGLDHNRVALLVAILEKKMGLQLSRARHLPQRRRRRAPRRAGGRSGGGRWRWPRAFSTGRSTRTPC